MVEGSVDDNDYFAPQIQWNLSVAATTLIKFSTCDLFSNVF